MNSLKSQLGQNIEELLETVLLVAEVEELKVDPSVRAIGTVIEARLDKGKGGCNPPCSTRYLACSRPNRVVIPDVRMTNDLGRRIKTAAPSTPVSLHWFERAPMAGDHFAVYEDEKAARAPVKNAKRALMKQRQQTHRVSLDNLFDNLKAGELKIR